MATSEEIADLRRKINEPTPLTYTDLVLSSRLDTAESPDGLARTIWREKAAQFADLADIREGNSDRKLSQLYKQALVMADSFAPSEETVSRSRRSRTRPIERQ